MWQLLLLSIGATAAVEVDQELIYAIPGLGAVRGKVVKTPARDVDVDVNQFTGIPFAQPPVGDLRFAKPKPVKPWDPKIINATTSSPSCMQVSFAFGEEMSLFQDSVIQEDCLYLNIWVPERDLGQAPLPVMVWIYGGGFVTGSIATKAYTGDVLAAVGNVVVVAINYRVAAFGFAHLADPELDCGAAIPGNIGLMDQQLGLNWVKDNIRAFGGDPDKVTIFGESAGGGSVTAQLAAPGSSDLFIRAIPQSGSIRDPWATRTSAYLTNKTIHLATKLGCTEESYESAAILSCLREVPAEAILNATDQNSLLPLDNDPCFFQGSVYDRLSSANLSDKSIIMGNTFDEYTLFMMIQYPHLFPLTAKWELDRSGYTDIATGLISYNSEQCNIDPIFHGSILWHYDNATKFGESYVDRFARLGTDFMFVCGERRVQADWLRLQPEHNRPKDMYLYIFNQSLSTPDGLGLAQLKASHGADISYTFGEGLRRVPWTKGEYDNETDTVTLSDGNILSKVTEHYITTMKIIRFWTNFAKFGNPNGDGTGEPVDGGDVWEPATDADNLIFRVLQADDAYSRMIPDMNKEDCALWEEVLEGNKRLQTTE